MVWPMVDQKVGLMALQMDVVKVVRTAEWTDGYSADPKVGASVQSTVDLRADCMVVQMAARKVAMKAGKMVA